MGRHTSNRGLIQLNELALRDCFPHHLIKRYILLRFILLFCLALAAGSTLHAQRDGDAKRLFPPLGRTWSVSLTASPDQRFLSSPSLFLRAADTVARTFLPGDRTFLLGPRDSIIVVGETGAIETFFRAASAPFVERPAVETRINTRLSLQGHYRFAFGLELALGVNHYSYAYTQRVQPDREVPDRYVFTTREVNQSSTGGVFSVTYQFVKFSRWQPYAGIRMFLNLTRYSVNNPRLETNFSDWTEPQLIAEQFLSSTIYDSNLDFLIGLQYRISPRLSIGLEGSSSSSLLPYFGDVQVRYNFGPGRGA